MAPAVARPFVKWAGGKTQLLEPLKNLLPRRIRTYYEPFLGGGALFFELARVGRFQRAALNDGNLELIDTYRVIRDFPEDLLAALRRLKETYGEDGRATYLSERNKDPLALSPVDRAARHVFLNRTGFNGLYRVNKKGHFNVPFGKYVNPRIVDETNIHACSLVLNGFVVLTSQDFAHAVSDAQPGDVVYLDPPYLPRNTTANFTAYTSGGFTYDDQIRVAIAFKRLADKGVAVIASNSDTEAVRDLYQGYEMHLVQARRNINSKGDQRGPVGELLIVGRQGTALPSLPPPVRVVTTNPYDELSDILEPSPATVTELQR